MLGPVSRSCARQDRNTIIGNLADFDPNLTIHSDTIGPEFEVVYMTPIVCQAPESLFFLVSSRVLAGHQTLVASVANSLEV